MTTDSIEQLRRAAEKNPQFHWSCAVLELIERMKYAERMLRYEREENQDLREQLARVSRDHDI